MGGGWGLGWGGVGGGGRGERKKENEEEEQQKKGEFFFLPSSSKTIIPLDLEMKKINLLPKKLPHRVDQQVLRLQVPVQHPVRVAVGDPGQHLIQVQLDEPSVGTQARVRVHVFLEVQVQKLKDEVELGICVDDVLEPDDVGVLELFQQRNLPDGRGGDPFLFLLEPDLLEGDRRARRPVSGLVDDAVGALADLLDFLVLVVFWVFFFSGAAERRRDGGGGGGGKR